MFEENTATNPEKLAMDERVDKLEATMQIVAATLQTISLTLSTLTIGLVPSLASLVPTILVPPVPIPSSTITLSNRAKDPLVTQLQFPLIYENQPLMGGSSSHAPQLSSFPFKASYPPLKMNNPTLSITTPFTLNIPPLIGQVLAIQPNPLVEILRLALEDGKSREVDHKLKQLEEALKAMQGPQAYGSIDLDDLCYYLGIQTNFKFKQPDFDKYDGSGCPYAHLQMYARKMAPYANDERVLIHYFQDNLSGPVSVWFSTLDRKKICTFKDMSQAFMRVQDLIDEGKLQLDTKETKGAPNITWNPLPPHGAPTMNMVTFDEVDRPVLENATNYTNELEYSVVMIDEALVCPYHSNMKEHALQDCGDFQRKVKELQAIGSLKFMFALKSKKFIALVIEEYFTRERLYILQDTKKAQVVGQNSQQPHVLKTCFNESFMEKISSMANSHFPYSLKVMPQHYVILNPTTNDVSNMTSNGWCYVNPEVEELRRAALKSKDIRIEEAHLDALLKVLKEAHVPKNIDTQKFRIVVGAILTPNYINFTNDEIPDEGNGHPKALYISIQCRMMNVPYVLIDNGSALNVIPMTIFKQLKVDESHINQCNTVVRAFDGTRRNVIGKIELLVEIVNGEEEHVIRKATTIPYLGVDPGTYESSYHLMECAAASYIHPRLKGKKTEMAKPTKGTFGLGYKPKKEDWQRMRAIKVEKCLARLQRRDTMDEPMWVLHIRVTFPRPVEILCPSLDGYVVKHMGVLYVDLEGTVFIDRSLEIGECSKQAKFEEVVVEDITDEVYYDDEEDYFGFNNLFGRANMADSKERWRRILAERIFMKKHPNFHLVHHAKAPMGSHKSMPLESVKEESLCDLWGNLTRNALNEEELEFDRGISLVNGSS
ncbi:hypothetical protein SLEP1_g22616 [Rubroshorea leprosula]|uniref:Uncharacterized protein n=1 Tax=Rubroshorea leprosula TaxID=152421 RepID=A0AAV5JCR8_9ROSI|nr:hypothetical protein SLEP1_g22616 [Rubroshorea leprosula]